MRVAAPVTKLVMTAVYGHPLEQRPLHRHRTEDAQDYLDRPGRLEGSMREQPVEAERDPQHSQMVHAHQQTQLKPTEPMPPQKRDSGDQPKEGKDDREQNRDPRSQGDSFWTHVGIDSASGFVSRASTPGRLAISCEPETWTKIWR